MWGLNGGMGMVTGEIKWEDVVVRFLLLWYIPWPKIKLRRKGFIWITLQDSWRKLGEVNQTFQNPKSNSWCRGHGWELLTGLLSMACSIYMLIEPRANSQRWHSGPLFTKWEKALQMDLKDTFPQLRTLPLMTADSLVWHTKPPSIGEDGERTILGETSVICRPLWNE